ncbi:AMP-binding protein [Streptomyces acidicola]|uniref:AMP-binding protein n=1 Tax=Streptomyces acidicola TaxID=2596892 RepID=UPI0034185568
MPDRWITSTLQTYEGDSRPAHTYLGADGDPVTLSRSELLTAVRQSAGALTAVGLRTGDRVALVADGPASFVPVFLGALWAGVVPVPLPPPPPLGRLDAWRSLLGEALAAAAPKAVVAPEAVWRVLPEAPAPWTRYAYELLGGRGGFGPPQPVPRLPDDIVYLQFSSGSTGRPRAVAASAGAVSANAYAIMRDGLGVDPGRDRAVSWLPLHHDMGLVGFVLAPLAVGMPVTLLPTRAFVRDPGVWMRVMSEARGTITFAPNFAFGLAARRVRPEAAAGLDLSGVRVLGCGGEPVNSATLHRFTRAYAPAGLDPGTLLPCYGLAESTLAVTFGRGPLPESDEPVNCGRPFPGHEVAVTDATGTPCAERAVGEIWVRGPSVAAGYLGEPAATARTFRPDGWLRTGDRGYLADGELRVTGRLKDVLVVNGRTIDPTSLEWCVQELDGVREGGVVAFTRPARDTEEVVVVAECRPSDAVGLDRAVRAAVAGQLALAVGEVVAVRAGTIPRTTSGKPRRQETRRRHLAGQLAAFTRDVPGQHKEADRVHSR